MAHVSLKIPDGLNKQVEQAVAKEELFANKSDFIRAAIRSELQNNNNYE